MPHISQTSDGSATHSRAGSRPGSQPLSRFFSRNASVTSSTFHSALDYSSLSEPYGRHSRQEFDYDVWLTKYKQDFEKLYNKDPPSPSIGLDEHEMIGKLGAGKFGSVHLVREYDTGTHFAVKIMLKEKIVKLKHVRQVINEKKILFALKFPFVISLVFSTKDNDCIYLGMPFVIGGDLFTYHRKRQKFSENDARFYAAQVYMALEYLHSLNCIYRDLKPENILIDARGYLKLTDFGFAKLTQNRTMTLCGTPEYLAPEIINTRPYGRGVDWWAFGILLYELVAGQSPFARSGATAMDMFRRICDCDYEMPKSFSIDLQDLISSLLQIDVTKRIGNLGRGCKDIQKHTFFRTVSWSTLLFQGAVPPFIPRVTHDGDLQHFRRWSGLKKKLYFTPAMDNRFSDLFRDF